MVNRVVHNEDCGRDAKREGCGACTGRDAGCGGGECSRQDGVDTREVVSTNEHASSKMMVLPLIAHSIRSILIASNTTMSFLEPSERERYLLSCSDLDGGWWMLSG